MTLTPLGRKRTGEMLPQHGDDVAEMLSTLPRERLALLNELLGELRDAAPYARQVRVRRGNAGQSARRPRKVTVTCRLAKLRLKQSRTGRGGSASLGQRLFAPLRGAARHNDAQAEGRNSGHGVHRFRHGCGGRASRHAGIRCAAARALSRCHQSTLIRGLHALLSPATARRVIATAASPAASRWRRSISPRPGRRRSRGEDDPQAALGHDAAARRERPEAAALASFASLDGVASRSGRGRSIPILAGVRSSV